MSEARLSEAEREALIEAIQDGDEVEYVERILANRLAEERERAQFNDEVRREQIRMAQTDPKEVWKDGYSEGFAAARMLFEGNPNAPQ